MNHIINSIKCYFFLVNNYEVINNKIKDSLSLLEILTSNELDELNEIELNLKDLESEKNELEIETLFDRTIYEIVSVSGTVQEYN